MDYEAQLKLQAFLDGELSPKETREVANWLAQDQQATALLAELRNTRQAMVGFEIGVELPESREFFWSKVSRQIEALEPEPAAPAAASLWAKVVRRFVMPAAALSALAIAGLLLLQPSAPHSSDIDMEVADPGALTYYDSSANATMVWLSYPADSDAPESEQPTAVE